MHPRRLFDRPLRALSCRLEQPADRLRLDLASGDLSRGDELVVLDEAQTWPTVFERLRGAIDADRGRRGRFLLLGSVSPSLMTQVSESLAGRLALVELTPLTLLELPAADLDRLWLHGGYPDGGVLAAGPYPVWQRDYLRLLAQRDLPAWGLTARPQTIERLLRMVAALHGQTWNASEVGRSLGLSYHTVNTYTDYLVGAFLLRRLAPWHGNLRKRLARRPRLFWRDAGLLHATQLVTDRDDLLGRPFVGASWEGFVIEQALATLLQTGVPHDAFYFRTSGGHELDLVLDFGAESWAVEVKLTSQPTPRHLARLTKAADMVGAARRFLVTRTDDPVLDGPTWSCRLEHLLDALQRLRHLADQRGLR